MPSVSRTFTTTASPEVVFDYLSDFRNAEEWDPGTKSCERISGDGGVGTTYRNVSSFMGREAELTYTAAAVVRPTRVDLRGHNKSFKGQDLFEIRQAGAGSEVTYHADFTFLGLAKLISPLVAVYLPSLASKTVEQMRSCLDRL